MTDDPPRESSRRADDSLAHHAGHARQDSDDDGRFEEPAPLTEAQRAALVHSFAGGNAPQKACADAGVDPLHFIAALGHDAELAARLGRLETVRSLNVLAVTYQKALSGASADRSLYLKFRPPPPPADAEEEVVELDDPVEWMTDRELKGATR